MSIRIAVALAATIGAVGLISSAAEARPEMVGVRGDYTPGTIVVKTNERRLYLILEQGRAVRYPGGGGRAGKAGARPHADRRKTPHPGRAPPRRGEARQAEHTQRDCR